MADLQLSPSMQPAACSEPEIPWSGWMPHDACALLLKVPEELLSKICPSGRAVMLFATSKRVRERLAQTQPLVVAGVSARGEQCAHRFGDV